MADPTNPRPTKRKVTDVEKEEQHPPIQPISLAKKYASGPPSASLDVKEPPRKKKKISGSHDTVPQKPNRKTKGDGRSAPIPTSTQKPPLVTTADIDSTSATTIKGKGKAPAKKTKNASKESKAFEISEENEFIILCWNNQGCERDFHLSGQRLWSEVTERYKVKFNKPDTSVGAVQGRYFVWHQRYCEADSEYAETIAKEAWAASKTAAKAKKRNMTPKEGTAGLAKELSKTKKEKTSSTTNTIESTKSSKKSETALKVNAPLLTKMPAPKSGESIKETQKYLNKDASPETAASMSDESEEHKFGYSNLHLENGFSQTLTRRWLNEQGDKVKFWFDRDVHEDALNQCDPIYVSRDALLTSSTTSQSWAKKYPHTHTVVVPKGVSHKTVSRWIQCISPTRSSLPEYDVYKNENHPSNTVDKKITWSTNDFFELYDFAQHMGTAMVCDMVTDQIHRMYIRQARLKKKFRKFENIVKATSSGRLDRIDPSELSMNVLGFEAKKLNRIAEKEPNTPILRLFSDIFHVKGGFDGCDLEVEHFSDTVKIIFDEAASKPQTECLKEGSQAVRCARYHKHNGNETCYKKIAVEEPEQIARRAYDYAENEMEDIVAKMKMRLAKMEKELQKARAAKKGRKMNTMMDAHRNVSMLYKNEDVEMLDTE